LLPTSVTSVSKRKIFNLRSKARAAKFPVPAQTFSATYRLRSRPAPVIFFTPAHRSAPAHSIFDPLRSVFRSDSAPLTCSAQKLAGDRHNLPHVDKNQKYDETGNTFCGTWYLPHNRVHKSMAELCSNFSDSAITKGLIAYFSLRMRETPIFLLPVKNQDTRNKPVVIRIRNGWKRLFLEVYSGKDFWRSF